ncbi:cold shock protein [uncultured Litoreibacter sp.]|uniref:cold-shock protein n=1 Tax=uncultured Litoreibacter sp. TaxID=1392394 RepID=UPI0026282199|nr:cold shock protein [uncultured Litoreibacter sp.]
MTETLELSGETSLVAGHVKWFDAAKGFGFVVADAGGPDILLHANVLRNFGQGSVADASQVELRVQRTERGLQAVEVVSVTPPEGGEAATGFSIDAENLSDVALTPARVKWFDKAKGFGFANAFGENNDIFLHIEVLRKCGLADLEAGEGVCLRIVEGDRGQMAAEVHSWDYALNNS